MMRLLICRCLCVAGALCVSGAAFGYRTAADDPAFSGTGVVRWPDGVINYAVHNSAGPNGISAAQLESSAKSAFQNWTELGGVALSFEFTGRSSQPAEAGDGVNTIQFINTGWEKLGFESSAAAVTDVQYVEGSSGQWVIAEADLYLNGESQAWDVSGNPAGDARQLESVLIHEAGHMLGLWHPCEPEGAEGAPSCDEDSDYAQVAMYPLYMDSLELTEDDVAGVQFLYPADACLGEGCGPSECQGSLCDLVCERNSDCKKNQRCVSGLCTGIFSAGEKCSKSSECFSGLCAEQGFCVYSCADCEEMSCVGKDGAPICTAVRFPVGASCDAPEGCLGDECLAGTDDGPLCTMQCDPESPECPTDWNCLRVDEADVCAPPDFQLSGGGGCAFTHRASGSAGGVLVVFGALLAAPLRRKRRLKGSVMKLGRLGLVLFCGLLLVGGVSCGSKAEGNQEKREGEPHLGGPDAEVAQAVCEAGRQVSCACPGEADGAQRCKDDGSGFGVCVCDGSEMGDASVPAMPTGKPIDNGVGGNGGMGGAGTGGAGMGGAEGGVGGMGTGGAEGGTAGAAAFEDDPCPGPDYRLINCSDSCGAPSACATPSCDHQILLEENTFSLVIRTPALTGDSNCRLCTNRYPQLGTFEVPYAFQLVRTPASRSAVFEVDPPWFLMMGRDEAYQGDELACRERYQCIQTSLAVMVATTDPAAPARNVEVRRRLAPCPESP